MGKREIAGKEESYISEDGHSYAGKA